MLFVRQVIGGGFPIAMTQELTLDDVDTVTPPDLRATMEITTEDLQVVKPPVVPKKGEDEDK